MIAIVESGSTKSDWRLLGKGDTVVAERTAGFNPYFTDTPTIRAAIADNPVLAAMAEAVKEVRFYGAGCSSPEMNRVVEDALRIVFTGADVHVEHDLLGAALAAGQGERCIVGILGTGSNCCYFDGKKVDNGRASLGYILGDEAGGAWFGKRLLADHLHGLLPEAMSAELNALGAVKATVLDHVYRQPRPNTYLAGFMPLLARFRESEYAGCLLREGFSSFLQRYACHFEGHSGLPVHFVGSVAHHFSEELTAAVNALGLRMGRIVHRPIDALVEYHLPDAQRP